MTDAIRLHPDVAATARLLARLRIERMQRGTSGTRTIGARQCTDRSIGRTRRVSMGAAQRAVPV